MQFAISIDGFEDACERKGLNWACDKLCCTMHDVKMHLGLHRHIVLRSNAALEQQSQAHSTSAMHVYDDSYQLPRNSF